MGRRRLASHIPVGTTRRKLLIPRSDSANLTAALDRTHQQPTAEVLPTHTRKLFDAAVARAAELLSAGEVVALPTETVYGLAANALDRLAVARVFEIKGRPDRNPIIVHVASRAMAQSCVAEWPPVAEALACAFWPGPLTLVLPKSERIPNIVTAGGSTVGVRWPSHPFIQAVIRACDFPLAAPSANLSNRLSPTSAAHVNRQLGGRIPLIVDGGQSQVGIESTVLDLTTSPLRVLRPGMIRAASLQAALAGSEIAVAGSGKQTGALRSPGLLPRHYAPRARLLLLPWRNDAELHSIIKREKAKIAKTHVIAHTMIPSAAGFGRVSVIPHDAESFARAIYGELHQADDAGAECITVEALPDGAEWEAIADRLRRASASSGRDKD